MIKIRKSRKIPERLLVNGREKKRELCEAYKTGKRVFKEEDFKKGIYSHPTVKKRLHTDQLEKCCYCESYIDVKGSHVEHYRPKSQYYWLVYEWSNLLLSCSDCNSTYKTTHFPLEDEQNRVTSHSHHQKLRHEKPLIINPAKDAPETYIAFLNQFPFSINDNLIGQTTIKDLGLDRPALNKKRRDLLILLETLLDSVNMQIPESAEAQRVFESLLNERTKAHNEFSATVRCAQARNFYPRTL